MVLDHDPKPAFVALDAELVQAVGRQLRLFVPGEFAVAGRVDADAVAAEERRGVEPLQVVLHRLRALRFLRRSQVALAVAHDEQALHALARGPLLHFAEVGMVLRLVLEHLVHVLDAVDAHRAGDLREFEIIERLGAGALEEALVQRPLGEPDFEGFRFRRRSANDERRYRAQRPEGGRVLEKGTTSGNRGGVHRGTVNALCGVQPKREPGNDSKKNGGEGLYTPTRMRRWLRSGRKAPPTADHCALTEPRHRSQPRHFP